ncbi:MAG: nucleoside diphosphate kinase regulator [Pseudomonadota bacterium]|nr:nucleoside diphosphate kinase regulator [Pseudomonadota bacterium]
MRKVPLWILAFVTLLVSVVTAKSLGYGLGALVLSIGAALGVAARDFRQTRHAILRNFPLIGHVRYLLESVRPEINQYFVESHQDGTPFSRELRSVVYQRAKKETDSVPFGTRHDTYGPGHEWVSHSLAPSTIEERTMRTVIGGPRCTQPYDASIFNVSAMSFGALSKNAVLALNGGAAIGGFAHNTGEGGVSPYHLEPGGSLIWQIGTGYFGCRTPDGRFCPEAFAAMATRPQIKMIELKLSQGAKPGLGGILPAAKLTPEIAAIRGVPLGHDVHSPPAHTEFSTPVGLLRFLDRMRQLSGGKPVGIKLCIGSLSEFVAICKAMVNTGLAPDFINVDGAEGGTGAAPLEFTNHVGMPLLDALVHVRNCLVGFGLRDQIAIIATGRNVTGFDLVKRLALGADACGSARAMMLALGCIQALQCNTNKCPTGVATQNPRLARGLDVPDKAARVASYQRQTVLAAKAILEAMGLPGHEALLPEHIQRRLASGEARSCDQLYPSVAPGSFAVGRIPEPYAAAYAAARADSFHAAPPSARVLPGTPDAIEIKEAKVMTDWKRLRADTPILVTEQDYARLTALLGAATATEVDAGLDSELERATIVPPEQIPANVVTMNSEVAYVDEDTGRESRVRLVYPRDANPAGGKLSVFAPIGSALLGLSVGQAIAWELPYGRVRTVRVTAVDYQPEAAGHWDL